MPLAPLRVAVGIGLVRTLGERPSRLHPNGQSFVRLARFAHARGSPRALFRTAKAKAGDMLETSSTSAAQTVVKTADLEASTRAVSRVSHQYK